MSKRQKRPEKPKWTHLSQSKEGPANAALGQEIINTITRALGRHPDAAELKALEAGLLKETMASMVQLKLAGWTHAALMTLKEDFDFDQDQLARFAQGFRARASAPGYNLEGEGESQK